MAGLADGGSLANAEAHLDRCDRCRRALSALAAAALDDTAESPADLSHAATESGLPRTLASDALWPGQRLGRFTVRHKLGQGAMGEVWAAHDPVLDRDVALKLLRLRAEAVGAHAIQRLRREAQAMARLNHPDVVTIYELGTDGSRIFCAMELIDGVTLREWLETPRGWREVLAIAVAVGRGLAAAHAAGVVHRDVKPDNVLVGLDGRARITDFGLAKLAAPAASTTSSSSPSSETAGEIAAASHAIESTLDVGGAATVDERGDRLEYLTRTGMVVGTPAYMAPEQLFGGRVDAASDQFGFCVMAFEALFGTRPFAGATVEALAAAVDRGAIVSPTRQGVPRVVLTALRRGLRRDPGERWPSMADLVRQLERRTARRRPLIAAAVTAVAIAAGAGVLTARRAADRVDETFRTAAARIESVWGAPEREAVRLAFIASGSPGGQTVSVGVVRALDRIRDRWLATWLDAWSSTYLRREQGAALLARRQACLDARADELAALVAELARADAAVVARAGDAVLRLGAIDDCTDLRRLESSPPPATSPAARALEASLRHLEASVEVGRAAPAIAEVARLVVVAERLPAPALAARAVHLLGRAEAGAGRAANAEQTLRYAIRRAAAAHDPSRLAAAWLDLARVVAADPGRAADVRDLGPAVRAAIARAGDDPARLAELETTLAVAASSPTETLSHLTLARDHRLAAAGPDDLGVVTAERALAAALDAAGQSAQAARRRQRADSLEPGDGNRADAADRATATTTR